MKPLTAPLAQVALGNVHPSQARPAPPSSRPMRVVPPDAKEPDRSHVDKPGASEVAAKKTRKRAKVTAETRSVAVARVEKLMSAGNSSAEATKAVAKELGVSEAAVYNWRGAANKNKNKNNGAPEGAPVKLEGLDLILDIIELCDRAKRGLSKSQRSKLKAMINERLS